MAIHKKNIRRRLPKLGGGGFGGSDLVTRMQASSYSPSGSGFDIGGVGAMASGIAGIGSGFIDMFANPDDINYDRYSNINEGAAAGKSALSGAAKGAAAGMALGPIGAGVGAAVGGLAGAIFGKSKAKKEELALNEAYKDKLNTSRTQSRLMNTPEAPTYLPVAKQGGYTVYNGETHKGPNGGIMTDEFGNPTGLSEGTPIALTENKEVARYDPHTGSTYIYSDSLGFAKPANDLVNKYKLNKSNSLLYKQYKNDSLLQTSIDKQFENLTTAQEFSKGTKTKAEESIQMARGGTLPKYDGEDPWPSYLDVRARNTAADKLAKKQLRGLNLLPGNIQDTEGILLPNTPSNPFPGNPYRPTYEDPLEILEAKPIIRKPTAEIPRPTGTGRTPFSLESGIVNTQWDAHNVNTPRVASPLDASKLATRPTSTATAGLTATADSEYYNPMLNPAGHLLSAAGNLADYAAMKKAKPEDMKLPRVGAERIDLSRQRLVNDRNASAARATNVATARSLGTNAGSTFSNIAASNTGVSRLLGEQNMQSLVAEETTNAQMEQQANMMNAQIGADESMMNNRQQNAYRMAMARLNPAGNMARTAASYFADNSAYQQGYDTLRMLAPDAELYGEGNRFIDRFKRPNVRLRDKSLY